MNREDLFRQKIVWGEISDKTKFALDENGEYFAEATTFLMTGRQLQFLTCFLNSCLSEYLFSKIGTTTGVGTVRWKKFKIEQLIVPRINEAQEIQFSALLSQITMVSQHEFEEAINRKVFELCGMSEEEIKYVREAILSR